MGRNGGSPRYIEDNTRASYSICSLSSNCPIIKKYLQKIPDQSFNKDGSRDKNNAKGKCFKENRSKNGFYFKYVPSFKNRWFKSTNFQFKTTKPLSAASKIPPHKPLQSSQVFTGKRLPGEIGYNPSIFSCSNKGIASKISDHVLPKRDLCHDVSTLWSFNSPSNICKAKQLDSKSSTIFRNKSFGISRRLVNRSSQSKHLTFTSEKDNKNSYSLGMVNKLQKSRSSTTEKDILLRNNLESYRKSKIYFSKETNYFKTKISKDPQLSEMVVAPSKIATGEPQFRSVCDPTRPITLSQTSKISQQVTSNEPQKEVPYRNFISRRISLVDGSSPIIHPNISEERGFAHGNRCLRFGMGGSNRRFLDCRYLDSSSNEMAHQSERDVCSFYSYKKALKDPKRQINFSSVRQSNNNLLHSKPGRNKISYSSKTNGGTVKINSSIQHPIDFTFHPRSLQCNSGLSVSSKDYSGVALIPTDNQCNIQDVGVSRNRSVRIQDVGSGIDLCVPGPARSRSSFRRCFQSELELQPCLDFSASNVNASSSSASEYIKGSLHNNSTKMGKSFLETRPGSPSSGTSLHDPKSQPKSNRHKDAQTTTGSQPFVFGGLEDSGWNDQVAGWNKDDLNLLETAWRKSTLNTYKAPWNNWLRWAKCKDISINNPSPQEVALYLSYLHRIRKLSYSSILVNKSVICTFANPIRGEVLSSHPIIRQMLKAISLKVPPRNNKKNIWDVDALLNWMKSNQPNIDSLFEVSRYVAILLLLASGRRVHDLTLLMIDEDHCQISVDDITLWPIFGSKTDKASSRQSGWKFLDNADQPFNAVFWIKKLIEVSGTRRKAVEKITNLFISTRGKVRQASKAIIGGWIRTVFKEAQISATPGSIRSAVGSKKMSYNFSLDDVLACGNWKNKQNFFRFYFKEISKSQEPNRLLGHPFTSFKPI